MPVRQDKSEPSAASSKAAGYAFLFPAIGLAAFSPDRDWYGILGFTVAGIALLMVGSGRVYRPAVTRTPDDITCRYNPWREGSLYVLVVAGPGLAVGTLMQLTGGVRIAGVAMLFLVAVGMVLYLRESRRCLLRITPASLTVAVPARRYAPTEIPRERIVSITGATGPRRNGDTGPVTEIAYLPDESSRDTPSAVLIGPTNANRAMWVTVEQSDLLAGLQAWKDGEPADPTLLDRVGALLRGEPGPGRTV